MSVEARGPIDRPDFMAVLGLLPPYTLEDVKAAYRSKVLEAHPDRGGNAADFVKLEEAYERALDYVRFRGDRRGWIAHQVDVHLRQQEVVNEVARLGGTAEFEQIDWLKRSFGDGFALLAERLRVIRLCGSTAGDDFLAFLTEHPRRAPFLVELDLSHSRITDQGLAQLSGYEVLKRLNLAGTAVTGRGLRAMLGTLPLLEWLNVADTGVGWWSRGRLRWAYPKVKIVAEAASS